MGVGNMQTFICSHQLLDNQRNAMATCVVARCLTSGVSYDAYAVVLIWQIVCIAEISPSTSLVAHCHRRGALFLP
jgi:hypothetical protein